jgi:predicted ribonuclease YlaK
VIIDTNILVEHQRPDSVNWPSLIAKPAVRIVVPLRVLEEIDAMKYQGHERRRQVAREILPWLERILGSGSGPVAVRSDTTIEVQLEDPPRDRPMDADEEILDVCAVLRSFAGDVCLLTADSSMRIRARALGIDVRAMDPAYRRTAGNV